LLEGTASFDYTAKGLLQRHQFTDLREDLIEEKPRTISTSVNNGSGSVKQLENN